MKQCVFASSANHRTGPAAPGFSFGWMVRRDYSATIASQSTAVLHYRGHRCAVVLFCVVPITEWVYDNDWPSVFRDGQQQCAAECWRLLFVPNAPDLQVLIGQHVDQ